MGKRLLLVLVFLVGCETTGTGPASRPAAKPSATPAPSAAPATAAKRDKLEGIPLVWKPTTNFRALRRAVRRDHDQGRPCRADQLRRLSGAAHQRSAA